MWPTRQSVFQKQYAQKYGSLEAEVEQSRAKIRAKDAQVEELYSQGSALRAKYDSTISGGIISSALTQPLNLNDAAAQQLTFRQPTVYSLNSSGPEVEKIQTRLKELNCYSGEISGHYDEATKQAVERFNRYRGEAFPSGVVDDYGWTILFSPLISEARTPVTSTLTGQFPLALSYTAPAVGPVYCPKDAP
jgi:Putative peptidoglycan binding domain